MSKIKYSYDIAVNTNMHFVGKHPHVNMAIYLLKVSKCIYSERELCLNQILTESIPEKLSFKVQNPQKCVSQTSFPQAVILTNIIRLYIITDYYFPNLPFSCAIM